MYLCDRLCSEVEFIINGAGERVVVSQLHRSPGVDFLGRVGRSDP